MAGQIGIFTVSLIVEPWAALTLRERLFGERPSVPEGQPYCVIYANIDRLHLINETHGFECGDEVIKSFAGLLGSSLLPKSALAARVSGDCFLIALPGCEPHAAKMIASRLKDTAAKVIGGKLSASGKASEISVSCGVAAVHDTPDGFSRAISAAELACRAAKEMHRRSSRSMILSDRPDMSCCSA
jgi:diguanylate cyclase (GGDEF)-like protein